MKRVVLFFLMAISSFAFAKEEISSFSVYTDSTLNPIKMNLIAEKYEVVKKLSPGFEVYVPKEKIAEFLAIVPNAKLLDRDIHEQYLQEKVANLNQYRKFNNVEADLLAIVAKYPQMTSLEVYGVTKGKRNLYSLKIKANKNINAPKLMVTAATHGDELVTTEVLFSLTNELLEKYGKDSRITKILDGRDLYIIPVVSPDSFEQRERYVGGVDPNRSYPWPENINNKSVDCIEAMINYSNKMKFNGSLDLHAYGKLVMYPWGYTKKSPDARDEIGFKDIVQAMARENNYENGQISTTIYVAKGSSADYFYWKSGTKALAAELGTQKIPDYSKIPKITNEAREMFWTFLEYFN